MSRISGQAAESILVEMTGPFSREERHYAVEKFHALAAYTHRPLRRAHVTVVASVSPGAPRPIRLSATIDLDGQSVQAHVAGDSVRECIDLARQRLYGRLVRKRSLHSQNRTVRDVIRTSGAAVTREHQPGSGR